MSSVRRQLSLLRVAIGALITTPGCFALFSLDNFGPGSSAVAGDATDAANPLGACDPSSPFTSIAPISELNTAGEENWIYLAPDELSALVVRAPAEAGSAGRDVFFTSRTSRESPFQSLVPITDINTPFEEDNATFTADGLAIYFQRAQEGTSRDLMVARRPTTASSFTVSPLSELNTDKIENDPYVTPDEQTLYFTSNQESYSRIARSRWTDSGFGAPTILTGLEVFDAGTPLAQAVPSSDGELLYFAAAPEGHYDIFFARKRGGDGGEFTSPLPATELNTGAVQLPAWLSPDRCRLYFVSGRDGSGQRDLYLATRTPR